MGRKKWVHEVVLDCCDPDKVNQFRKMLADQIRERGCDEFVIKPRPMSEGIDGIRRIVVKTDDANIAKYLMVQLGREIVTGNSFDEMNEIIKQQMRHIRTIVRHERLLGDLRKL